MMSRILPLVIAVTFVLFLSPVQVTAQESDSSLVTCSGANCQPCHLVQMANNIIEFLVIVLTAVAALIFAYAGFILTTSGGDVTAKEKAKTIFTNVLIGYLIVLAAWLLIDTGMKALLDEGEVGPWNEIKCETQPKLETSDISWDDSDWLLENAPRVRVDSSGNVVSGGSCDVITDPSNDCSPESFAGTCFEGRAEDASEVCNLESAGGQADIMSGTDLCQDGSSFSGGLWQINLLVHADKVPGCNLPNQGQGECLEYVTNSNDLEYCAVWDCSYAGQEAEYNQCVEALQNPETNTEVACQLYNDDGFQPWQNSANECGVAY